MLITTAIYIGVDVAKFAYALEDYFLEDYTV